MLLQMKYHMIKKLFPDNVLEDEINFNENLISDWKSLILKDRIHLHLFIEFSSIEWVFDYKDVPNDPTCYQIY